MECHLQEGMEPPPIYFCQKMKALTDQLIFFFFYTIVEPKGKKKKKKPREKYAYQIIYKQKTERHQQHKLQNEAVTCAPVL